MATMNPKVTMAPAVWVVVAYAVVGGFFGPQFAQGVAEGCLGALLERFQHRTVQIALQNRRMDVTLAADRWRVA
jgi:xanthine dehydrogenase molybdopterin-binding subunit B